MLYEGAKLDYTAYKNWKDQTEKPHYDGRDLGRDPYMLCSKMYHFLNVLYQERIHEWQNLARHLQPTV